MSIFKRFDHVSIGVKDWEKARHLFLEVLGGEELPDKGQSSEGFDWFTFNLGGKKMEVVHSTREDSGVGRYVEKYGEGYHHISIAVHDLKDAIAGAAELAGLEQYEVDYVGIPLSPRDLLLRQLAGRLGSLQIRTEFSMANTFSSLIQSFNVAARELANLDDPSHLYVRCIACGHFD